MTTPVKQYFDKFLTLIGEQAYDQLSPEEFRELEAKIIDEIRRHRRRVR